MGVVDMMLLKTDPPEGWIDLGIGEAHLTRDMLIKATCWMGGFDIADRMEDMQYPRAKGEKGLLKFLQEKYNTDHVVITTGAKHAVSGALYALKNAKGIQKVYVPKPHWLSFPTLIRHEGLIRVDNLEEADAVIFTSPNNPDGHLVKPELLAQVKQRGIPIIFDYAYNVPQYLDGESVLPHDGDVHAYSYAKTYGLSGVRVGYVVCRDIDICTQIEEFVEITTSGVALPSQWFIELIERYIQSDERVRNEFYTSCRQQLEINRKIVRTINPEVLDTSNVSNYGMFVFLKGGPKVEKVEQAKVKLIEGEAFGIPGYYRLSLGVNPSMLQEAVDRINNEL